MGSSSTISVLDGLLIGAFVVYSVAAGLRERSVSSRNLEEYFLAGRTLAGWKAGISMAATQFAADTPLLVTGMIATAGVFSLWRMWIYAVAFLLMGFVLGGPWRRAGVLTDAELAELRYSGRYALALRVAKALYFGTLFNCAVLAMVLLAATRIAEPFLTWHAWLPANVFEGVVNFVRWAGFSLTSTTDPALAVRASADNLLSLTAVIAMTAFYSATGGLRAVVNTDVVQFTVAIVATAAYAVVVVREVGGLAAIPQRLAEAYGAQHSSALLALTPTRAPDVGAVVLGTMAIQWLAQANADGTGYLAQRTMACRSDRDARDAAIVFTLAQIVLRSLLWIAIGLSLLLLFPLAAPPTNAAAVAAREATFVEGVARFLPSGVRGLMLTGMLAALASTLDTHLNWGASYWSHDLYGRLYCGVLRKQAPSGRALVWAARLSTLWILVLAGVVITHLSSIESAWKASLLLGAGMGLPLVMRWLWWRMSAVAEIAAIAVCTLLAPPLAFSTWSEGARLLTMAACSSGIVVAVSLWGKGERVETLAAFYRKVRPPGFWGPIASACGDDPREPVRRLVHGLAATFGMAFSAFCLLVGGGTLLFGSPPPTWFPWSTPWVAVLLLCGAVGVVTLWRASRREPWVGDPSRA